MDEIVRPPRAAQAPTLADPDREPGVDARRPQGRDDAPARWRNLVEVAQYRGRHQRDKVAFTFLKDGETEVATLTYGELDRRARLAGGELRRRGATGERVLLLYPQGLDFIVAFFGALYAGAAAVPAPRAQGNRASLARLQAIADDARPKVVLASASLLAEAKRILSRQGENATVATLEELLLGAEQDPGTPSPPTESLALLQYTSGSTRAPRGVMITHANIVHNQELIRHWFEFTHESVVVGWLPMFHDMGLIGNLLQPVYVGCTCFLMSPVAFLQEPCRWLRALSRYGGTTAGAPNFAYDLCVDRTSDEQRAGLDLSTWELAYNGSEPVGARTLERFVEAFEPYGFRKEAFYPCYGMAEATLLISGGSKAAPPVLRRFDEAAPKRAERGPGSAAESGGKMIVGCGKTGHDQKLLIFNPETLRPLPDGQVGEIWLAGASVSPGYWNRPRETRETFGACPAGTTEANFLRTGDLGFIAEGEIFVTGRIKDMMIVRGQNHYPQDIEQTAQSSHPALRPNCGAAFLVEGAEQNLLVIVQDVARRFLREPPVGEIAGAVRAAVAKEHGLHVAAVVLLKTGALPKTSSGKIQRSLCRSEYLAGNLPVVGEDRHGVSFWKEARSIRAPSGETAEGTGQGIVAHTSAKQIGMRT